MALIGPSFIRATKGDTVTWKFTTTVADVPTTLTTPTVKAYEEGSDAEFTGGITLTTDYDSKTGLHELVIDTSNAAYTAGKHYDFFFSAGSIGAVTLVGTFICHLALIPVPADPLDQVVEGTVTIGQSLQISNAALGGKLSGGSTTTNTVRDVSDTKNRIVATVDGHGNRSAVTLNLD